MILAGLSHRCLRGQHVSSQPIPLHGVAIHLLFLVLERKAAAVGQSRCLALVIGVDVVVEAVYVKEVVCLSLNEIAFVSFGDVSLIQSLNLVLFVHVNIAERAIVKLPIARVVPQRWLSEGIMHSGVERPSVAHAGVQLLLGLFAMSVRHLFQCVVLDLISLFIKSKELDQVKNVPNRGL